MALAGTLQFSVTPRRLAGVLAPLLASAVLAAPAQADRFPFPTDTGGVEVLDTPDDGGTAATGPFDWPGDGDTGTLTPPDPLTLPGPLEQEPEPLPPVSTTYVAGKVARLRTDGKAAIPRGAPKRVRSLIRQYNRIVGKRYLWGGGHTIVEDKGYDCSGAVGYGLIKAGMLRTTLVSGSFARWAAAGPGRWMTIYANRSHVYAEIAGLRLDTSPYGDLTRASGVRWRPLVGQRTGFKVRHPVGL